MKNNFIKLTWAYMILFVIILFLLPLDGVFMLVGFLMIGYAYILQWYWNHYFKNDKDEKEV